MQMKHQASVVHRQNKRIDELTEDNAALRKSYIEIQKVPDCVIRSKIRSAFLNIFTANQTDILLSAKKKVVWTPQEIALAFSLR